MKMIKIIPDDKIRSIAVDFDGTLCEKAKFPAIGLPKIELIDYLREQREKGVKLILWTCREGEHLKAAVEWCREYNLEFDSVNCNLKTCNLKTRKVVADIYIDDRACIPYWEDNNK